jgi:hypothetical protein
MKPIALVLACAGLVTLAPACAHPPPRGPVATTKGAPGPARDCADAPAPFLGELCAMGEPSLSVTGPETYRFVWTRHQRNPVAVRVSRAGANVAVVSIELDAHDPSSQRRHEFVATGEAWTGLLAHLEAADFWHLPGDPGEDDRGLDGADWIIEGRRGGVYHSVIRWEPQAGPFRDACADFITLSGLSFPAEIR